MFRSAGCSLWRAGGFFCYLEVLYGGPRINILQFFLSNKFRKNLDLDPDPGPDSQKSLAQDPDFKISK
jgi:hypothetical protein